MFVVVSIMREKAVRLIKITKKHLLYSEQRYPILKKKDDKTAAKIKANQTSPHQQTLSRRSSPHDAAVAVTDTMGNDNTHSKIKTNRHSNCNSDTNNKISVHTNISTKSNTNNTATISDTDPRSSNIPNTKPDSYPRGELNARTIITPRVLSASGQRLAVILERYRHDCSAPLLVLLIPSYTEV